MSAPAYDTILKLCAQSSPAAWFPAEFAAEMGIDGRRFDRPLGDLKVAGLVDIAEFQPGRGQGYRLTAAGAQIARSPDALARLRDGRLPEPTLPDDDPFEPRGVRPVSRGQDVVDRLVKESTPYLSYAILGLNVGLFLLAMYLSVQGNQAGGIRGFLMGGDPVVRHRLGALTGADLLRGDWWRIVTTTFAHGDVFWLLINMSTFLSFGPRAEQVWGRWRALTIYILAGVAGVCLSLWHHPGVEVLGAAGSVCGIILATAAWFALNRAHLPRELVRAGIRQALMSFAWWMAWMALINFLGGFRGWWGAYAAGALTGVIVAVLLHFQQVVPGMARWLFLLLVAIVPLGWVSLVLYAKRTDPEWKKIAQQVDKRQDLRGQIDEKKEREQVQVEWMRPVDALVDRAEELLDRHKEWVGDLRPMNAPPEEQRREFAELRKEFGDLADKLDRMPVPDNERAAKARRTGLQLAQKYTRLLDLLDKKMQPNIRWNNDDQENLEKANSRKNTDRDSWKRGSG